MYITLDALDCDAAAVVIVQAAVGPTRYHSGAAAAAADVEQYVLYQSTRLLLSLLLPLVTRIFTLLLISAQCGATAAVVVTQSVVGPTRNTIMSCC